MSNTSIGRGPASGGNENHDGDPLRTTLGETVGQEAPAGGELVDEAVPESGLPAGVKGAKQKPGISKGRESYPDGPDLEASPRELDAAPGKLRKP